MMFTYTFSNKLFLVLAALSFLLFPTAVFAHHGWGWATGDEYEITGEIVDVRLGNPHGEVDIMVDNERWVIEVGQPWRNARVGLDEQLQNGRIITVHGHRSARDTEMLVKAERVVIDGKDYTLYPNRES